MRVERIFSDQRRPTAAEIAALAGRGVEELILVGDGAELAALVAACRAGGIERVVLETAARGIDAEALARAGLGLARLRWNDSEQSLAGARALAAVGVRLEASIAVEQANLERVGDLPRQIAASGLGVSALSVRVARDAPSLADAARAVESIASSARQLGLAVRLDPDAPIPPCSFEKPGRVAHLYALSRGGGARPGFSRVAACASCAVGDRCPGVPDAFLSREPELGEGLHGIAEDRLRRRLSVISSVKEQIERELLTLEICRRPDGSVIPMHTVRVNFHCNQACHFCFVSTHLPPAEDERIREAIVEAGKVSAILALSGGEPTLNPRLEELVRLGKASGAREIELQTNATRLGDPGRIEALTDAGVDVAFVSLHGSTTKISDAVTMAPGTFELTLAGLDAVQASSIALRINFVFCELNRHDFANVVSLVAERWPKAQLSVSFIAPSTDLVPRDRSLVPRYSDVLPEMARGLRLAHELGVPVSGFESMCGLPLCLIPSEMQSALTFAEIPDGLDRGEFEKPEPCAACDLGARCYGVRRGYAELYGTDELRPVHQS
jgi:pyruvate-formate lyase-activating enzyme